MAVKSVVLLGIILFAVILIMENAAYARELKEANGGSGLKDEKPFFTIRGKGYIGGSSGNFGRYGGPPSFGFPDYGSRYGFGNGGTYGDPGYGGIYGGSGYGGGYGGIYGGSGYGGGYYSSPLFSGFGPGN